MSKKFKTPIDQLIEIHMGGTITLENLLEAKKDEQNTIIGAYKQGETDREDDMLHQVRTYESGNDYYNSLYELNPPIKEKTMSTEQLPQGLKPKPLENLMIDEGYIESTK